jgi:hypothetical protein
VYFNRKICKTIYFSQFPQLQVTDKDVGVFGVAGVRYGLYHGDSPPAPFRVDALTGQLYVYLFNDSISFNREVTSTYTLTVKGVVHSKRCISFTFLMH